MRPRALMATAAISLLLSTATASADVQRLYNRCKEPESSQLNFVCLGYIAGVGETMDFLGLDRASHPFAICGRPSHGAMVQAFINWAEKHPSEWKESEVFGVMQALAESWPCPSR